MDVSDTYSSDFTTWLQFEIGSRCLSASCRGLLGSLKDFTTIARPPYITISHHKKRTGIGSAIPI